ncbi:hypothetical protein PENSPDRAFT_687789 [Peniophora sp. CONT]|nr:hypothetical protein PENSPDRAFT_687789 [Peniophora sp. CONT]
MDFAFDHFISRVSEIPVETLTAILSHLPDPPAPRCQRNGHGFVKLDPILLTPVAKGGDDKGLDLGWLPAAWVCQLWRSVILSQTHLRIPILIHDELSLGVMDTLSPLPIDLYIDEELWGPSETIASRVQSTFQTYGHRLRSLHVWTALEKYGDDMNGSPYDRPISVPGPLLPNVLRDVHASYLREVHAEGNPRHFRGGCLVPDYRDDYPLAVSLPLGLSNSLRILDLFSCTVANASALKGCAPTIVRLLACPGIWDRRDIRPDPGVISDRDDVTVERFSMPFLFHALRYLYLDEDSMPSREALAALGPIAFPVLERLHLSGLLTQVQDTIGAFTFPPETSVKLVCAWDRYETSGMHRTWILRHIPFMKSSSYPFYKVFVARYLNGGAPSIAITSMKLVIEDVCVSVECCSEDQRTLLTIHLYYNAQWDRDFDFTDSEIFFEGMFSVFPGIRELAVSSVFRCETYSKTGALRRCRWYTSAVARLTNVTKLILSAQAAQHLLEFCEESRRGVFPRDIFPDLVEMKLNLPSARDISYGRAYKFDKAEVTRLLNAELEVRAHPFQAIWDDEDGDTREELGNRW